MKLKKLIIAAALMISGTCFGAGTEVPNIMHNSNFDDPENPLKYWTVEYANLNYAENLKYVQLLPEFGGKKNVLRLITNNDIGYGGFPRWQLGSQADSPLIPFEQGARYRFTFSIMASCPYHIYAIGYGFNPGLKPYENPVLPDMRMAYKGGICEQTAKKGTWTKVEYDWPDKQLSDKGMAAAKNIKYFNLHVINIIAVGEVYFKDLAVIKLPDGYTGGKVTDDNKKPATGSTSKTAPAKATSKTKPGK